MPRALVLGANGQDGSYLAEALIRRGYDTVGAGRQPASRYVPPGPRFQYRALDLADGEALKACLHEVRPDCVFHVAAIHGSAGFRYEPVWDQMVAVNVVALHTVLEFAREHARALRTVYAGSSKIFPAPLAGDVDESTPYRPTCLYSIGKIAALELMRQYRSAHGIAAANLVLFNHESPRRGASYLLPTLARGIVRAKADPAHRVTIKTADFWADWSAAQELMDLAVDVAERAPAEDFVFASGTTWHGRDAIGRVFARHGLDAARQLVEELPPGPAQPSFRVRLDRMQARLGRRPQRDLFAIMDELVAQAQAAA